MPRSRTSSGLELLVELDRRRPEPLRLQLERSIRAAIRDGRLEAGTALPSSRALASQLGVSRGIAVEAFEQLVAEGYVQTTPGGSTRVAARAAAPVRGPSPLPGLAPEFDFRPGRPDVDQFPRATWLRALRRALAVVPGDRLTYGSGEGTPELRSALAAYLNRVRGTAANAPDIVISSGFAQGLRLVLKVLVDRGISTVAVEDPSDPEYRVAVDDAGLRWVPVPVDEDGLDVDALERTDARAVVVTAAHQYPTGGVLPPTRRAALVDWATRRDAIIVEDDYDAEFRYDRMPIGAIQGLAPDRVVYAGSASKTLAPGLRLGWLVLPQPLVESVAAAKVAADMGSPTLDQLAFAEVLAAGELDRHLRRMRPIYRRRRDALLEALGRHLPSLDPTGASAGLHLLAWLPADLGADDGPIVAAAAEAGIAVGGLTARRVAAGQPGLVFGYGTIHERRIDAGIRRLASVLEACATPGSGRRSTARAGSEPEASRPVVAVYGTLRSGERNHHLLAGAELLGAGSVEGRLFALPANHERAYAYPAFVPGEGGVVMTEVYRLPTAAMLDVLDELEAYNPGDESGSEYLRRREDVQDGPVPSAWVYRFAGELPDVAWPIEGGDWRAVSGSGVPADQQGAR